jgi:nitrogen regulatory protein PII
VTAIVRPHRIEAVKTAVAKLGVGGLSVTDVRGRGQGPEEGTAFGGDPVVAFRLGCRLDVVVEEAMAGPVVEAIVEAARTGTPGDGKVFVEAVADAVRVRTGEHGVSAV